MKPYKIKKTTDAPSLYDQLEEASVRDLLKNINLEDAKVSRAVGSQLYAIESLVKAVVQRFHQGGRLFYMGAGTSGRLGVLDASECLPTFGIRDKIIGLIAGGNKALRNPVENAEDDTKQGWKDLLPFEPNAQDTLVGITASGNTPYVLGVVQKAKAEGLLTAGITCNENSALSQYVDCHIEIVVGPEFVTGSTRMKAGTAQKMVLNMISTSIMIQLKRVRGNRMVDMQISNQKLVERGTLIIAEKLNISKTSARQKLLELGSVRKALESS